MPENITNFIARKAGSTALGPLALDANGNLLVSLSQSQHFDAQGGLIVSQLSAQSSALGLSTATLVKAGAGSLVRIIVNTAGTAAGSANDAATVAAAAVGNLVFSIPNTVGVYQINFPMLNGIVITPGTGQVVSVAYS